MPQRSAFERARHFVWYRTGAPVFSIILAPFSGLFLVLLLCWTGLLLDLALTRGVVHDPHAVDTWVQKQGSTPEAIVAAKMAKGNQGVGLLAVAIRAQATYAGPLFAWLIDVFPELSNNYIYLISLVTGILVLSMLYSGVSFLQKRTAASAAIDAITRLRRSVHTHAYRLGSLTMRQVTRGPIVGSTMRALDTLQEGLYGWFVRTVHEPCNLLWLLGFLVLVDCLQGTPWCSAVLLAAAGLYWLLSSWITSAARRAERRDMLKAAEGQVLLMESLGLHRLVKTYGMEQYGKNRLERLLHRQGNAIQSRWYWQFLSRHGRWSLFAILGSLVGLAVVGNILNRELRVIPIVLMLMTIGCIYVVLHRWQLGWRQVRKAVPAAEGLFQLLDQETDVKQVVGAEFLPPLTQKLELSNVTVLAPGSDDIVLDGITLMIAPGEHVALVGDDQARLAVAYLVPRLIDPDQGEVRIDDKALTWVTLESVRRQVGVVLQDDLIFNDTVAINISCGSDQYDLPKIIEAAKAAHAHHFIMKLPSGYETLIGELGNPLTASQKFRIALARAILRDPAIMVVEEPQQDLSDDDKTWFDDALGRFLQGRTTILLPSRLSSIRKADRVVMLSKGAIVDQGSDADLIRRCQRYQHWQYMMFHHFQDEKAAH